MKKKIAILGSTGSIGKSTLSIIKNDKKNFNIILLSANSNYKKLLYLAKKYNVNNLLVHNKISYLKFCKVNKSKKIKIFNTLDDFHRSSRIKFDYTMSALTGLGGLKPTLQAIKISKKIAIANKESIICGWNLINKELLKYKTEFVPVDSEHFSIWSLIQNINKNKIEKIYITASGGPFLRLPLSKFKKIKSKNAIKHPNWSMGKKISIDSATLMNKVFEIIEAQKIFDININKFKILIHPDSYVHAIVKFSNGITKILSHDTNMKIPIFNTLYNEMYKKIKTKKLDIDKINSLNFQKVDPKRFPSINIIKKIKSRHSLFETVIVSANDTLVELFLNNKIKFTDINLYLNKIIQLKEFKKFQLILPAKLNQITRLDKYVRLKTYSLSVYSR